MHNTSNGSTASVTELDILVLVFDFIFLMKYFSVSLDKFQGKIQEKSNCYLSIE